MSISVKLFMHSCSVPSTAWHPFSTSSKAYMCDRLFYMHSGCFPVQTVSKLGMLAYGSALSTRLIHYGALPFTTSFCTHLRAAAFSVNRAAVMFTQKIGLEVLEFTRTRWRLHDALYMVAKVSLSSLVLREMCVCMSVFRCDVSILEAFWALSL